VDHNIVFLLFHCQLNYKMSLSLYTITDIVIVVGSGRIIESKFREQAH